MAKLSKQTQERHLQACNLLEKEVLTYEDKYFILENWQESYSFQNGLMGAFFTPVLLARELSVMYNDKRTIDLCAGIGCLAFHAYHCEGVTDIVCIEKNPEYVEVGKKILPEATWICGDILDEDLMRGLGKFENSISNPPFGNVSKTSSVGHLKYRKPNFELKAVEVASKLSKHGFFILPTTSVSFTNRCNGVTQKNDSSKADEFTAMTGIEFDGSYPIDTRVFDEDWRGVKVAVELVYCDFTDLVSETLF